MSSNPYAPPQTITPTGTSNTELAGRFTRFAAAMVDGILASIIIIPISFATGYFQRVQDQQASILEQLAMSLLGLVSVLIMNGYLLYSRGQTIGKLLTSIQIVDAQEGKLLPFLKVYVFRYLWLLPVSILVAIIPGQMDDFVVNILAIVDALLIFGPDRRCLHDYIAGSKVVLYQANRPKLG